MANSVRDRILIVENDPILSDIIARQSLQAAGYQTMVVADSATAVTKALQYAPDILIVDLSLPGLSAKDMMVALQSQNIEIPVIVLAQNGKEGDIIQAFRLGAVDYLAAPVRETEVINVVERVLKQVRERRERERLARQLQQTNQELQSRVRELTTIFAIGKAVTSITDPTLLFEKIIDGALKVSQADLGWFMLRSDTDRTFTIAASRNLPASLASQPWDDGISSLVAMSGEPLSIHGEPLRRFKVASLGGSALIMPVKAQKEVIGLLVAMRKTAVPFSNAEQSLLGAVTDYASIAIINVRLFRAVEERAGQLQHSMEDAQINQRAANNLLAQLRIELGAPAGEAGAALENLVKDPAARWSSDQRKQLSKLNENLARLQRLAPAIYTPEPGPPPAAVRLNDLARAAAARAQHFAQAAGITLVAEVSADALTVQMDAAQAAQVIEALLSNAIKFTSLGGRVSLRLERSGSLAHIQVSDTGIGMDPRQLGRAFTKPSEADRARARGFGGLGIQLNLVQEMVVHAGGKIWADSQPNQGSVFHIQLPLTR